MKQSLSYLFLCLFIFASCSPKMTTTLIKAQAPLEEDVEVKVFPPEAQEPEHAIPLQTIKLVGDDYDELVEMAKDQARQAGGNVLQIVKHLSPDISCPRNRMAAVALSTCDSLSTDAGSPQSFASELDLKDASKTIRIALQGGIAYRLGTRKMGLNTAIKQHVQNMKWGGSLRDYLQTVNGVRQYVCFENNNKENLSHVGLSIGLRYNL